MNNLQFTNEIATSLETSLQNTAFSLVFVLVDENTRRHCLPQINNLLPANHQIITINSGELNKTLTTCAIIWQNLTDANADRQALLINLGGGVICDMGGFCARTYKRGIQFWNIPTSLLSQVDASVGGKLGIDFGVFKNQIGLFSEPDMVFVDSSFLKTLPADEIVSGFAEIIKHALISDREMFYQILDSKITDFNWQDWVPKSVAIKNTIVEQDPKENGLRKILNFGHTIGHAVESHFLDCGNALKHGEAVAIGMIAETFLSVHKGLLSKEDGDLIINYLLSVFPQYKIDENAMGVIVDLALQDKKNINNKINAVLLNAIGNAVFDSEITDEEIRMSLIYYNRQLK